MAAVAGLPSRPLRSAKVLPFFFLDLPAEGDSLRRAFSLSVSTGSNDHNLLGLSRFLPPTSSGRLAG